MSSYDHDDHDDLRHALDVLAGVGAAAARPDALLGTVRGRVRRRRALKQVGVGATTLAVGGALTVGALQLAPRQTGPVGPGESPTVTVPPSESPTPPAPTTPATTEPATPAAGDCSAAGKLGTVDVTGLPPAVQETVSSLVDAATTCDDEALIALAESFGTSLTFGGATAREKWELPAAEQNEPVYDILRGLLTQTRWATVTGEAGDLYVWPRVYAPENLGDDAAWQEAVDAGAVPADLVPAMRDGGGYLGWRLGIAADGTWRFFVGGD